MQSLFDFIASSLPMVYDQSYPKFELPAFCNTLMSLAKLTPTRLFAGALLTLLASAWAAPPARGACGDYPFGKTGSHSPSLLKGRGQALHDPTPHQDHQPLPPQQNPKPCQGPHCSRGSFPPVAPASVAPQGPEHWAWMISLHPDGESDRTFAWFANGSYYAGRFRLSIFHPPRQFLA